MDDVTKDQIIITKGISMINQLTDGHVIKTMMKEHEHILKMLDELKQLRILLLDVDENNCSGLIFKINQLTRKIISAEPHHKREEEVLFPILKDKGTVGPTQHMVIEHEMMRVIKHKLKKETKTIDGIGNEKLAKISSLIHELCNILQLHIYKENTVLYPLALNLIRDESIWIKMKNECDKIGYCCFCPDANELDQALVNEK
ncbi:uncharacterized protein METZ01_LOCUS194844 [marine metagenome]|uniref:Hemerythrin-like domain-containing protein n=1 Tax=marine metagenome TaxID=408172 RepID=A0A382DU76_9ZZZZ|tara:strand:- start:194 stop:799 length:606 start_codon:yes stop_codon:yes gene_type:complete